MCEGVKSKGVERLTFARNTGTEDEPAPAINKAVVGCAGMTDVGRNTRTDKGTAMNGTLGDSTYHDRFFFSKIWRGMCRLGCSECHTMRFY